jgi:hypothetical protein
MYFIVENAEEPKSMKGKWKYIEGLDLKVCAVLGPARHTGGCGGQCAHQAVSPQRWNKQR